MARVFLVLGNLVIGGHRVKSQLKVLGKDTFPILRHQSIRKVVGNTPASLFDVLRTKEKCEQTTLSNVLKFELYQL